LTLVFGQFDQKEGNENSKIIPFNVWAFDNLGNREYDFNFRNLLLRRENYGRMNNISHKIKYIQYIQEGNLYFYGQLADSLNVIAKDQRVSGRFYLNGELIASSQPVFTDENGVFEFSVPYDEAYWKVKVSEKGSSLEGIEGHFKRLQSREFHIHTGLGYLKGNNHILYYR
ncbi:MAG: hypothetical protein OEY51_13590, partial [Cyclobacteriaceae bacterium]|nr:hypothetical protein [Cyclobacteriaceae bacterium]